MSEQHGNGAAAKGTGGSRNGGRKTGPAPETGGPREPQTSGQSSARQEQDQDQSRGTGQPFRQTPGRDSTRQTRSGWGRYLVAPKPVAWLPGGVPPIEASALFELLEEDPDVEPLRQVRPSRARGLGAIAGPLPMCPAVAVVAMPHERAQALAANPQIVVEADQPLSYPSAPAPAALAAPASDPSVGVTLDEPQQLTVRVTGSDGQSVGGAEVWATGMAMTSYAVTGADGRARLTLPADTPATLRSLFVRPAGGYWPIRTGRPQLLEDAAQSTELAVEVVALSDTFEGFPDQPLVGWGTQAMRLHQIPPTYRGHGIRIALLDSGVDADHPDLKDTVWHGADFTPGAEDGGWQTDATGHGTRCAGVVAAADNRSGMTGIAADAELHALKLFPGGRVSDLLDAIDRCVTHDIDLAQINLSYGQPSQLVAWKLLDAHAAGIAVIAPAGDTNAAISPLAALPTVLAVGALAHTGTYPPGSPVAAVQPPWPGPFAAPFTPVGPGVDLIGPGAAIVTTVPGNGYSVADGTALAAAHLTGLAALLLAHHDQLRSSPHPRTAERADHLMALLRTASRPVPGTDVLRQGAGLPDAPIALGLPTVPPVYDGQEYMPSGPASQN
ncbi:MULTISPECIES: S8 family serine peptidase [unclassified Streptomyces]|uniref:S8 family serine peptidase n=1 Tax=unclassified Streptomyces TaxID=2593676 RepID=UPI00381B9C6F